MTTRTTEDVKVTRRRRQLRERRERFYEGLARGEHDGDIVADRPLTEAERRELGIDAGFGDDEDAEANDAALLQEH